MIFTTQKDQELIAWLKELASSYPAGGVVFSTSFGLEDQVIAHAILTEKLPIRIFTIDTGRLPEETHALHQKMIERHGVGSIETWSPDAEAVARLVAERGPNGFFISVENRLACCHVRKVEPLNRALLGAKCWITGIRREQSAERATLPPVERDEARGLDKAHPLIEWTAAEVMDFIKRHDVPYNVLHDQGYPSIGCAPCTRAILPGEDERAGRWWWELKSTRECGLHLTPRKERKE
jgi:phosphoadenosine phosphosulfate reductase